MKRLINYFWVIGKVVTVTEVAAIESTKAVTGEQFLRLHNWLIIRFSDLRHFVGKSLYLHSKQQISY